MRSKIISITQQQHKRTYCEEMKWLQRMIIPGIIIVILTLISPSIYKIYGEHLYEHENSTLYDLEESSLLKHIFNFEITPPCSRNTKNKDNFEVVCRGATCLDIQKYFNENVSNEKNIILDILALTDKILPKHWLNGEFELVELRLTQSTIIEINSDAFNTPPFSSTTILSIRNAKIKNFHSGILNGLNSLEQLTIFNDANYSADKFLEPVSLTLQKFELQGTPSIEKNNPQNLLSSLNLKYLTEIDLRNNNFDDLIDISTFKTAVAVQYLYLINVKITWIHEGAFTSMPLNRLDLKGNLLKTIANNLFERFENSKIKAFEIYLEDNQLTCDCNLNYLVEFYRKYRDNIKGTLTCNAPIEYKGKEINEEKICHSDQETTLPSICDNSPGTIPTTKLPINGGNTPSPTIPSDDKFVNVTCNGISESSLLQIKDADVLFSLYTVSDTQVKVSMDNYVENIDILWFNNTNKHQMQFNVETSGSGLGCGIGVSQEVTINGLNTNTSYTFCLVKRNETEISPFNCQSHYVQAKTNQTHHDDENDDTVMCQLTTLTITLFVVGVISAALLGGIVMYYIIRYRPTLLRGSPRVVIVNKSKDIMILPSSRANSMDSAKRTGSNKSNNTSMTNQSISCSESFPQRRYSDTSILSGRSYVAPNMYEAVQYQKKIETSEREIYFDKFPTNPPPPLPERMSRQPTMTPDDLMYLKNNLKNIDDYYTSIKKCERL